MMKGRKPAISGRTEVGSSTTSAWTVTAAAEVAEWEMRPGGMLVQRREASVEAPGPAPNLRLRVAHGAVRLEISVNPVATFGEVKKLLTSETGLHPSEQVLIFRGRQRRNEEYLDVCGVKDRSKVVLVQDPASIERRLIEMRRNAKIQSAHRAISDVSVEVDRLTKQVTSIEKSIANGKKVPEVQITTLIEVLMMQAVKLESISAEGDTVASLKNLQGKRVQKCVETLDALKISNARVKPVIAITTEWETFDPPAHDATRTSPAQRRNESLIDL